MCECGVWASVYALPEIFFYSTENTITSILCLTGRTILQLWYYRMWKPDVLSCVFTESYWKWWFFFCKTDVVFVLLKPHLSMNVWIPSPQVIKTQQRVDYRCGLQVILRWNFPQICFAGFCVTTVAAVDLISPIMQPCLLLTSSPSLWGG